jgi:hypothetical protein
MLLPDEELIVAERIERILTAAYNSA